ncbi:hypothetical protein D3C81_1899200 [compost metagenome]
MRRNGNETTQRDFAAADLQLDPGICGLGDLVIVDRVYQGRDCFNPGAVISRYSSASCAWFDSADSLRLLDE